MTPITLVDLVRVLPDYQKITLDINGSSEQLTPRLLADNLNAIVVEIHVISDTLTVQLLPQKPRRSLPILAAASDPMPR